MSKHVAVWIIITNFILLGHILGRPGSSVSIATGCRLDGPRGSNPGGSEIFRTCPDRPWGPPSLLYNGYRVFPRGVKSGQVVTLTPHPLLVPWSWKSRAIPLLPLWAVRPVQSLSVCTRVHLTFIRSLPNLLSSLPFILSYVLCHILLHFMAWYEMLTCILLRFVRCPTACFSACTTECCSK